MITKQVFITGCEGEIGFSLIEHLSHLPGYEIVAMDKKAHAAPGTSTNGAKSPVRYVCGDILDRELLESIFKETHFSAIFHLAGILSTGGERDPLLAHRVNVDGSVNLLELFREQSERARSAKSRGVFIFPSTIAAYGIPTPEEKYKVGAITEEQFLKPITIYGINKLYVEQLGGYFSDHFRLLDKGMSDLDFRCVRFPGLLSADTVPTGGTSDYGPQMLHAAAQGKPYSCFVKPESTLPFMAMPDAVRCLIELSEAPSEKLHRRVYNAGAFSISAEEIRQIALKAFPGAKLDYQIDPGRLAIVESWPTMTDDIRARTEWGWKAAYDRHTTFEHYLLPKIREHYRSQGTRTTSTDAATV